MGEREGVAEVLGDHHGVLFYNDVWCCTCLIVLANTKPDAELRKDQHLATVLASDWLAAHDERVRESERERLAGEGGGQSHEPSAER